MTEASKYGITFRRLDHDMLETVRQWRNSDEVRQFMQYQKIISPEEQLAWFEKINNDSNHYFVAYDGDEPYGLYNIKDLDADGKWGEGGVFLKSKAYWSGDHALRGSLLMGFIAFELLGVEGFTALVLKDNKPVLNYNRQLGFKIDESYESDQSYRLTLIKDDFYSGKVVRLINYLEKQYG